MDKENISNTFTPDLDSVKNNIKMRKSKTTIIFVTGRFDATKIQVSSSAVYAKQCQTADDHS